MDAISQSMVPQASFAGLPTELRNHIYSYILQERVKIRIPPARCPTSPIGMGLGARSAKRTLMQCYPSKKYTGFHFEDTEEQKAYASPVIAGSDSDPIPFLFTKQAIGQTSRALRAEMSSLLRLTTIDLVLEVMDFDFSPVQALLSSLPRSRLEDFFVAENGRSASTLRIDVRRPEDIPGACENLRRWLRFIEMLDVQELATAYRVTPAANKDFYNYVDTDPLLIELYYLHEAQWEGPARTDLYRFLNLWWARRTVELQLCSGTGCSRHPSPDDIPGLRSREHILLHDTRLHLLAPHYFEH